MTNRPNPKLLNGCTSILEKHSKSIHHNISLVEDDAYFNLTCNQGTWVIHNNHTYNVATFKNFDHLGFNFSLKFNVLALSAKRIQYALLNANLKIFYLNDNESQLLFRAEFATNEPDQTHAQPHWQFEPYLTKAVKENDYNAILELRNSEQELIDFKKENYAPVNISRLHFAMTSDWHKPLKEQIKDSCTISIDETNVVHWLDGCMKYLQDQIKML